MAWNDFEKYEWRVAIVRLREVTWSLLIMHKQENELPVINFYFVSICFDSSVDNK